MIVVNYAKYLKRRLTMTKNLQYCVTFETHGYILNATSKIFLIFNVLVATIVTPGFALNASVEYFLLET